MTKDSTITVRIPAPLKRRLLARARRMHRSLSAQVVHDLETLTNDTPPGEGASGRLLGLYEGSRIPTDSEIAEVRSAMWGSLGSKD